jgi:amidase
MAAAYDTENPVFGHANNPYDLKRSTGGSSGGEAAAITACLSPGGLGSDLAGSIRIPAHICGIVGLKPTTGRVPCDGHIPSTAGATSLGAVMGPLARSVEDVGLLFRVLAGLDEHESASSSPTDAMGTVDLSDCRVALHTFDGVSHVTEDTRRAVESAAHALENAGLNVREEKPPSIEHGHELWSRLFSHAALMTMRSEYAGREDEAGPLVRYLLDSSLSAPTAPLDEFSKAWSERNLLRATLLDWMEKRPLIISPVGSIAAFEHGTRKFDVDGEAISIFRAFSYSQTYNVFDLPVACVPAGVSRDGMPIGVQIIGRPFAEKHVLAAAELIEKALGGWREPSLALSTEGPNPL